MNPARLIRFMAFLTIGSALFSLFQNFTFLPLSHINQEPSVAQGEFLDARSWAPARPTNLGVRADFATPQSGADLNSVSSDWALRQARIWIGNGDQELLAALNRRLDRVWHFQNGDGDPWPDENEADGDNSSDGRPNPNQSDDDNDAVNSKSDSKRDESRFAFFGKQLGHRELQLVTIKRARGRLGTTYGSFQKFCDMARLVFCFSPSLLGRRRSRWLRLGPRASD